MQQDSTNLERAYKLYLERPDSGDFTEVGKVWFD